MTNGGKRDLLDHPLVIYFGVIVLAGGFYVANHCPWLPGKVIGFIVIIALTIKAP